MLRQSEILAFTPRIRQNQIVAVAMIIGLIAFAVVTCVIVSWRNVTWTPSLLSLIALVFGCAIFPLAWLVSQLTARSGVRLVSAKTGSRQDDVDRSACIEQFAGLSTAVTIVRLALLESAVLFNLVVFLVDRRMPSLIFAGLVIGLTLFLFPTDGRIAHWIQQRLEDLKHKS
jgi:hypothetical protein